MSAVKPMLQWGVGVGGVTGMSQTPLRAMAGRRSHPAPRVRGCRNGALCPLPFLCAPVLPMYPTNIYRAPTLSQALFQMLGSGGRHSLQYPWGGTGTEGPKGCFPAALRAERPSARLGAVQRGGRGGPVQRARLLGWQEWRQRHAQPLPCPQAGSPSCPCPPESLSSQLAFLSSCVLSENLAGK